ncbi:YraN family protein [Celeribacter halophilus]|uniref:YraN family protein n=1 Tax=Celeribacter halophilus TaxID=576117 RepID=UPI003A94CDEE
MPPDFVSDTDVALRKERGRKAYDFGLSAEATVARLYQSRGFDLLEERWRGRAGEIDLIFRQGEEIVFVEVKASKSFAKAATHLGAKQMVRLCASAEDYIGRLPKGLLTPMRVDLALVDGVGQVEILENALML